MASSFRGWGLVSLLSTSLTGPGWTTPGSVSYFPTFEASVLFLYFSSSCHCKVWVWWYSESGCLCFEVFIPSQVLFVGGRLSAPHLRVEGHVMYGYLASFDFRALIMRIPEFRFLVPSSSAVLTFLDSFMDHVCQVILSGLNTWHFFGSFLGPIF